MQAYESTGTKPWSDGTALMDLAYQAGNLLKLKMQLNQERFSEGKTKPEILKEIQIELAEIVALALFIEHKLELDVRQGFQAMLASDAVKIKKRKKKAKA